MGGRDASTAFRLGVLGSSEGWYLRDLQRAAALSGWSCPITVEALSFASLSVAWTGGSTIRMGHGLEGDKEPDSPRMQHDALLVRTMPLGSLEQTIFRMNALHVAQANGTRVINSPRSLEIAIDKWLTVAHLWQAGFEVPRTVGCQSRDEAMRAWREDFEGDCVVKPIFGGEGRGIVRITDADIAWRVFSALENVQAVLYLQEFLPSLGYDLRLLVIDDAVLCVRRENPSDWRTNVGRGGRAVEHSPSFEQVDLAFRASRAMGTWMAGIDVLPTRDGRNVLLEVNAVPGWRATAAALQWDVARLILERLVEPGG
jgi:RimK family alpha-L-glutamate ligase